MAVDTETQAQSGATDKQAEQSSAPDPVQAARDLLIAQGLHVLKPDDFARVKGAQAKEAEAQLAQLSAQYEQLQRTHSEVAKRVQAIDDQDKSKDQIWESRKAEWERQLAEAHAEVGAVKQRHQEAIEKLRQAQVDRHLGDLLVGAVDPELALIAARRRIPGELSVDENGRIVLTDLAGIERVGPDAEGIIRAWWDQPKQATLRVSAPAGPPASANGSASPPPGAPRFDVASILKLPFEERMRIAREADEAATRAK